MSFNKDYLTKLTLAVYRVTDRFPEKEPLKYYIREIADRILNLAMTNNGCWRQSLDCDFNLLKTYFNIAKSQNWVSERNFLILEREYDKVNELFEAGPSIEQNINQNRSSQKEMRDIGNHKFTSLTPPERKKKIAELIQNKEQIALRDLLNSFPGMSKRTIIRDLDSLLKEEIIVKEGNGKYAVYRLNGHKSAIGVS